MKMCFMRLSFEFVLIIKVLWYWTSKHIFTCWRFWCIFRVLRTQMFVSCCRLRAKIERGFFRVISVLSYHFWRIECAGTSLSAVNVGNFFNVKMYVYREIGVYKWQLLLRRTVLMCVFASFSWITASLKGCVLIVCPLSINCRYV